MQIKLQDPTFTVLCISLSSTLKRAAEIEPNISSKRKIRLHKEQALSAKGFFLTGANRLHD